MQVASEMIDANAGELFSSPHQVTLGNPDGDVTLVEFFDHSCGYCRRADRSPGADQGRSEAQGGAQGVADPRARFGRGGAGRGRGAMQDPSGTKYLGFHQQLLAAAGPATRDKALAAAREQGLDMDRLATDMASDEVAATLAEDARLASAIGATGTPTYVIGKDTAVGASASPR